MLLGASAWIMVPIAKQCRAIGTRASCYVLHFSYIIGAATLVAQKIGLDLQRAGHELFRSYLIPLVATRILEAYQPEFEYCRIRRSMSCWMMRQMLSGEASGTIETGLSGCH